MTRLEKCGFLHSGRMGDSFTGEEQCSNELSARSLVPLCVPQRRSWPNLFPDTSLMFLIYSDEQGMYILFEEQNNYGDETRYDKCE